ncbi:MAG: response regulator [Spartobacteria bacterium]|nr:response regulator [Spartobacteria bacterium]
MKMLTVDDSAMMRKIIADAGEVIGFECMGAGTGEEALSLLEQQEHKFDLILLDWNMPGMSGIEVLRKLKADERWKDIPVMMVTTDSEREKIIEAIQVGATNYLAKPFAPEDLISKMMQSVGQGL